MVLFASYSGQLGGAERLLVEFAGALEVECALACPPGPLERAARDAGLRVFSLRRRRLELRAAATDRVLASARLAGYALELCRLARDLGPELIVAWGMRSALACALLPRPGCPLAFQHNDLLPGRVIGALVRFAAGRSALVTVPSDAVASDLDPRGRLGGRIRVVSPGIDVERFGARVAPADPPQVLVLGAVTGWKRPDLALEACAIARRSHPELRLRLAGAAFDEAGWALLARLRARAAEPDLAGAVQFAGAVDDPRSDLAGATCLLHCAEAEPFGIAVLEALAAGRPAIVPAAAGPAEIVDQSCGLLYPPGDAGAAAAAIVSVVSNPGRATAMGLAGQARARARFDRAAARSAYAGAVQSVLCRGRGALAAGPARAVAGASELALVTVTHNSASHLRALLRSVQRHLPGVRVVVVDSASEDETVSVAGDFGCATTVALDQNVGFGTGSNRGIEEVREPVCALINPDVELIDASLLELVAEALDRRGGDRLLAPLVLSPDGSRQDTVHPLPGSPADVMRTFLPPAALPGSGLAPWGACAPRPVGWAVGCAVAARTDTLRRLGPFDEQIFLYGEDLDLGMRAAQAGIQTWFWPTARVLHHRAHASAKAFAGEPFERLARARHDAVGRRLGRRRARIDDASQAMTFASRIVVKRLLGRPAQRERRQLGALLRVRRADGRG